jgi:hypothetical protein
MTFGHVCVFESRVLRRACLRLCVCGSVGLQKREKEQPQHSHNYDPPQKGIVQATVLSSSSSSVFFATLILPSFLRSSKMMTKFLLILLALCVIAASSAMHVEHYDRARDLKKRKKGGKKKGGKGKKGKNKKRGNKAPKMPKGNDSKASKMSSSRRTFV